MGGGPGLEEGGEGRFEIVLAKQNPMNRSPLRSGPFLSPGSTPLVMAEGYCNAYPSTHSAARASNKDHTIGVERIHPLDAQACPRFPSGWNAIPPGENLTQLEEEAAA